MSLLDLTFDTHFSKNLKNCPSEAMPCKNQIQWFLNESTDVQLVWTLSKGADFPQNTKFQLSSIKGFKDIDIWIYPLRLLNGYRLQLVKLSFPHIISLGLIREGFKKTFLFILWGVGDTDFFYYIIKCQNVEKDFCMFKAFLRAVFALVGRNPV